MPAVMAHQNAPGATSQFVAQVTPEQSTPRSQPSQQQAYAHPMAAHSASYTGNPTNKLAYAALIVAAAGSIASFLDPIIIRGLLMADAHAIIGLVTGTIFWIFIIATAILAILALKKKDLPRGRWAAYAALGAAGSGALAFLSSMIGNFFSNFPLYF